MAKLAGTKTHQNLKDAFAGESQANRRYLYFAKVADVEGYPEVAGLFKDTADGETGHAHGHLDYLKQVGDPATGLPIGDTAKNLKSAVAGETHEYETMYPGFAKAGARGGLRRRRRVVRDARQGREVARRPLPEGARHPRLIQPRVGPGRAQHRTRPARIERRRFGHNHMSVLKRRPDRPPAAGPNDPRYWDARDLEGELKRIFQICHECRMCVGYCGTFPSLFAARRSRHRHAAAPRAPRSSTTRDFTRVERSLLAVQALLHQVPVHRGRGRERAARFPAPDGAREGAARAPRGHAARRQGARRAGRASASSAAASMAPLTNFVNRNRLMRKVAETVTGVSAEFPLPPLDRRAVPALDRRSTSRAPGAGSSRRGGPVFDLLRRLQPDQRVARGGARARAPGLSRAAPAGRGLLRHAQPRRRRRRRDGEEGARQRRGAAAARRGGQEDRRARADLFVHDAEGVAALRRRARGRARSSAATHGSDGVPRRACAGRRS